MMKRVLARFGLLCMVAAVVVPITARPALADVSIDGAGSTWSQIAIAQWAADVARQGISVNYQGVGSTSGRVFYYQNQIDFAASEIPFTPAYRDSTGSVITDEVALASHRPYAYMPDVAGGTSFMYHLDINGKRVNNLRLTPTQIAKIFTGVTTKWNDPSIKASNPGLALPNIPIRPIVRSDGSGTTAQFTAFMASQTTALWNDFCVKSGLTVNPCPSVSLWPDINAVAQQFSDGVADYVAAPYNNGAITYVEYGYAKQRAFPVASVLNKSGYFTQPSPEAVAIALKSARLHADRTQDLQGVYESRDARAYPVSSYSYMIVPTSTAKPFTAAKGTTLSKFILYMVCSGQQKAAQLGYSPLPKNLVQAAFDVVVKIPGHVNPPPIDQCDNPTITSGFDAESAPPPPASDREDAVPPPSEAPPSETPTGNEVQRGQVTPQNTTPTTVPKGGKKAVRRVAAGAIDEAAPEQELLASTGPVTPPTPRDPLPLLLYVVAAVVALVAIFGPPALSMRLKKPEDP